MLGILPKVFYRLTKAFNPPVGCEKLGSKVSQRQSSGSQKWLEILSKARTDEYKRLSIMNAKKK